MRFALLETVSEQKHLQRRTTIHSKATEQNCCDKAYEGCEITLQS
jgi:hypothetical protein